VILTAFLKPKTDNAYRQEQGIATGSAGQRVEGYLVYPALMPAEVQAEQAAECTFWRIPDVAIPLTGFATEAALTTFQTKYSDSIALSGTFYWEANVPGPFGVEQILGDKLKGRFVARSIWLDAL